MNIKNDIKLLSKRISLPLTPKSALWTVVAMGVPNSTIGPTDTRLYAFLTYDEAEIAQFVSTKMSTVQVDCAISTALCSDWAIKTEQQDCTIEGQTLEGNLFDNIFYHQVFALKNGNQIFVCLQSK